MTGSDAQNSFPEQDHSTNALDSDAEALLREKIADLDRLIALGLQYVGGLPRDQAPPAEQGEPGPLRDEIARREHLVAALEELEARRQEVRELRRRLDGARSGGPAPQASAAPSDGASPRTGRRGGRTRRSVGALAWLRMGPWAPLAYLAVIVLAEIVTALGAPPVGMLLSLALLAILPLHATFVDRPLSSLLSALALLPMIRVVSLAMPLASLSLTGAYLLTGIPLLIGAAATIWVLRLPPGQVGLRPGQPLVQAGIALLGVPLGAMQFAALGPLPVTPGGAGQQILTALVLVAAVAFVEEVIYRGVLQTTAAAVMDRYGLLFTSVAFAAGYIGNGSLVSVAIAFGFGLAFAWLVERTGSLLGVTLAHGLALVLAGLVLPMLAGSRF